VTQGDTVKVTLAENPTNGHRWAVDSVDTTVLHLQNSTYSVNPGGGIGGGGIRTMTFQPVRPGSADLKLKLWREWRAMPRQRAVSALS
jgi:predicted secreted protein